MSDGDTAGAICHCRRKPSAAAVIIIVTAPMPIEDFAQIRGGHVPFIFVVMLRFRQQGIDGSE